MQQDYQQLRRKRQKNYSIFNQQGHIVQVLQRGRTKRHIQTAIGLMSDRKCCLLHESILDFCSSQPSMVNWLSSPILFVRSFVCPAMVTSSPPPPSPSLDAPVTLVRPVTPITLSPRHSCHHAKGGGGRQKKCWPK